MLSAREFFKASKQRFTVAEWLMKEYPLDALYIAGYSVECALKALIMHTTPTADQADTFAKITSSAKMHYPENLKDILKTKGCVIPFEYVKKLRRFGWTTQLRYETGRRPPSEVRGYLRVAKNVIDWVQGEMK